MANLTEIVIVVTEFLESIHLQRNVAKIKECMWSLLKCENNFKLTSSYLKNPTVTKISLRYL